MPPESAILVRAADWNPVSSASLAHSLYGAVATVALDTIEVVPVSLFNLHIGQWSPHVRAFRNTSGTGAGVALTARINPASVPLLREALHDPEWVIELSCMDRDAGFTSVMLSFNPDPDKFLAGPVYNDFFLSSTGKLHKWRLCNRDMGPMALSTDAMMAVTLVGNLKVAGTTNKALALGDLYLRRARRDEAPRFWGVREIAVNATTPQNVVGGTTGVAHVQYVEIQNPDPTVYLRAGSYGEVSTSTGRRIGPGASLRVQTERADFVYVMRESGTGTAIIEWGV